MDVKFTKYDKWVIEENEKWFDWYLKFPLIVAVILAIGSLAGAISFWVFDGEVGIGFGVLFGGALVSFLTYFELKIVLSYKILQMYYLKKLCSDSDANKTANEKTNPNTVNNGNSVTNNKTFLQQYINKKTGTGKQTRICPDCRKPASPYDSACNYCGAKLL